MTGKRGEFLVNGPGHCAACHTPKTILFGDETDKALTGGLVEDWFAPDISNGAADGWRNGAWPMWWRFFPPAATASPPSPVR